MSSRWPQTSLHSSADGSDPCVASTIDGLGADRRRVVATGARRVLEQLLGSVERAAGLSPARGQREQGQTKPAAADHATEVHPPSLAAERAGSSGLVHSTGYSTAQISDRVRNRTPSGASRLKPEPRPGTTSMMRRVCCHRAHWALPM